jgi:hypothetical protein
MVDAAKSSKDEGGARGEIAVGHVTFSPDHKIFEISCFANGVFPPGRRSEILDSASC